MQKQYPKRGTKNKDSKNQNISMSKEDEIITIRSKSRIRIIEEPSDDDEDDDLLFEPPKLPKGQRIIIRDIEDKPFEDKTPRRLKCPKCGYRMRRIYFKRNYTRKKGTIIKRTKHSTIWFKLGWWCPLCNHVIINPEYQP